MKQKGFLGPIGDDLPSLIPLIFALIVFFGVFNLSLGVFEKKSDDFSADIAVLQIANGFRGTGYITSHNDFQKTCDSLNIRRVKYVAGLVAFDLGLSNPYELPDFFNLDFIEEKAFDEFGNELASLPFMCSNTEEELSDALLLKPQKSVISRVYPIALDFDRGGGEGDSIVRPVQLVIVAWK